MSTLKLLAYVSQVSMDQGAIQPKQYEQISMQCLDVQNLLGAWIISDQRRLGKPVSNKNESKGTTPE